MNFKKSVLFQYWLFLLRKHTRGSKCDTSKTGYTVNGGDTMEIKFDMEKNSTISLHNIVKEEMISEIRTQIESIEKEGIALQKEWTKADILCNMYEGQTVEFEDMSKKKKEASQSLDKYREDNAIKLKRLKDKLEWLERYTYRD